MITFNHTAVAIMLSAYISCLGSEARVEEKSHVTVAGEAVTSITKEDLLAIIAEETADEAVLKFGKEMINASYETNKRYIERPAGQKQFGYSFSLHPEVLANLMRYSRGKAVLELGAARGENSILLGLAGAREVLINDCNPLDIEECRRSIGRLPQNIQKKFHVMPGNCLQVFKDARFDGYFDVIYARSLFHFFLGEERIQFAEEVCRLLKPGGRLILAVGSALSEDFREVAKTMPPAAYIFRRSTPVLRRPTGNSALKDATDITIELDEGVVDTSAYTWSPIVTFAAAGGALYPAFTTLSKKCQKRVVTLVDSLIELNGGERLSKSQTTIDLHECHSCAYTRETLQLPFSRTALKLIQAYSIEKNGHTTVQIEQEEALGAVFEKVEDTEKLKETMTLSCIFCHSMQTHMKTCSQCKTARYCNAQCQKKHWPEHKQVCKASASASNK